MSGFLSLAELRKVEADALTAGLPLMERAGRAAADLVLRWHPEVNRVLILTGPGNNGGDGLVCARLLLEAGLRVDICCLGEKPDFSATELIVDALFGIGLSRDLDDDTCTLINAANASGKPILALDTPSGLDAYTGAMRGCAIRAHTTLTFLTDKPGLHTGVGKDYAGNVIVDALSLNPQRFPVSLNCLIDLAPAALQQLRRQHDTHKGRFGTVAIFGGAAGMLGAPLLAGRAALKLGAGKVRLGFLANEHPDVDLLQPELMLHSANHLLGLGDSSHIVVGPGLGQSTSAHALLARLLHCPQALVLDADALNLIAADPGLQPLLHQRSTPAIFTPHPQEAARLLGCDTRTVQADRITAAMQLAKQLNAIVLLKGAGSVCSDGEKWCINASGNAALSNAGQGDALAGILVALLAQGLTGFDAACCAAWLHGAAADEWRSRNPAGIGLTASEVIELTRDQLNRQIPAN